MSIINDMNMHKRSVHKRTKNSWHTARRGYLLLEIAIALSIIGFLVGGALQPLHFRYQQQNIADAESYMERAKNTLFVYALHHKTERRTIMYYDNLQYEVPAGRPYFPCPDVDLDGLEDRNPLPEPTSVIVASLTLSIAGTCMEQKGVLPWRTLGLPETDPWNNALSYYVDMAFSNALLGFDEFNRADIFDRLAALDEDSLYRLRADRNIGGAIICSDFLNEDGGGCPDEALANISAGIVTGVAVTLGARVIPGYTSADSDAPQGIIDSAVFVLVSHGRNGHGAVNADARCNSPPPTGTVNLVETANAYYRPEHALVTANIGCQSSVLQPAHVRLQESLFVRAPVVGKIGGNSDIQHDDLVQWASSNEVFSALLRGGLLPLANLDFLPN